MAYHACLYLCISMAAYDNLVFNMERNPVSFFFFEEIILFYAEQEILEEDIHGKLKHIIRFLLISG